MRPGQLTPENGSAGDMFNPSRKSHRFNEAGAINPGKLRLYGADCACIKAGFNEAGAINPGKRHVAESSSPFRRLAASMRPGQLTPENLADGADGGAGARMRCFNEAGAINPGKPPLSVSGLSSSGTDASMRPGQLTPENAPRAPDPNAG